MFNWWVLFLVLVSRGSESEVVTVPTTRGPVVGEVVETVRVFRSIPFARAARWRRPIPVPAWGPAPLDARPHPSPCVQAGPNGTVVGAEDCLYLYAYAPSLPSNNSTTTTTGRAEETFAATRLKKPVMVFVHGGGLEAGAAYDAAAGNTTTHGSYDAVALARRFDVVVFSIQYRLGALGYLGLPDDDDDEGPRSVVTGNYGQLDQIAALEWVRENANFFDGDPNSVTVFGESAGAISICAHLASPLTTTGGKRLFRRAIIESGSCEMQIQTLEASRTFAASFARARAPDRCGQWVTTPRQARKCLTDAPLKDLVWPVGDFPRKLPDSPYDAAPAFPWCLTVDGVVLADAPLASLEANSQNTTIGEVLLGFNLNEFQYGAGAIQGDALADVGFFVDLAVIIPDVYFTGPPYSNAATLKILSHFVGLPPYALEPLLDFYPLTTSSSSSVERISAMLVDATAVDAAGAKDGFGGWIGPCAGLKMASVFTDAGATVYVYNFTRRGPPDDEVWPTVDHGAEIPYVFQHCRQQAGACQGAVSSADLQVADETALSKAIGAYWTAFARAGDPNGDGRPRWPVFDAATQPLLRLDLPLKDGGPVPAWHAEKCAAWAAVLRNGSSTVRR